MASCANCDKTFEGKTGNGGFNQLSLKSKLPHSDEIVREALFSMTGKLLILVTIKERGQFLCPSCGQT